MAGKPGPKPRKSKRCISCGCDFVTARALRCDPCRAANERVVSARYMADWRKANVSHVRAYKRANLKGISLKSCLDCGGSFLASTCRSRCEGCQIAFSVSRSRATVSRRRALKRASVATMSDGRWAEVVKEYLSSCAYCGSGPVTIDHVVAVSRGGAHSEENCVPACATCNKTKHASPLLVWLARRPMRGWRLTDS